MTAVPIKIEYKEDRPADVSKRKWIAWMREGNKRMGEYWHKHLLPKHFTIRSRSKYRHRGRTSKYIKQKLSHAKSGRKWRRTGESVKQLGRVDNVLTGDLRARLESPAFTTVKAFPSRVTIKMLSIVYAPQRQRSPKQPDKIGEIFRNLPQEAAQLSKILYDYVIGKLKAFRAPRTTKTK